jgi:hypothetical protein
MKPMSAATRKLHEMLIRLAKGAIGAWEQWLKEQ